MRRISRGKNGTRLAIFSGGKVQLVSSLSFFRQHHIDSIIRLRPENFNQLSARQKYLTHFNLQESGHKVGKVYALPLIVKPGYYKGGKEVLPILSFENCLKGVCIGVREKVSYKELRPIDFKHSSLTIKTVAQLKKAILHRYHESMPQLSEAEILGRGVSVTRLKMVGKIHKS